MANCKYTFTSPAGEKFENVESLSDFCFVHSLDKKRMSSERKNQGWTVDYTIKSKTIQKEMKKSGLTSDEQVIRLSDQNTKLKQELTDSKRSSGLFKELASIIENTKPIDYIPELRINKKSSKSEESAILLLSDSHADQQILPQRVNNLESYNFNTFCKRCEKIVETTISHLTENMSTFSYKTLYIFSLGDLISGTIHGAKEHSEWKNSIKSSINTGEVFARMISDLSVHFQKIVFVAVNGNHGKYGFKKNYRESLENWDYLVATQIKTRLKNLIDAGRVDVEIPDSWSALVKIYDYNCLLMHGDDFKGGSAGLPHYAIQRKTYRLISLGAITNTLPHYTFLGHFHSSGALSNTIGKTFINGAMPATDDFAYNSLSAYSEPSQTLLGFHPKYGVTWNLDIKLRDPKTWMVDEKKISKYNCDLF